MALESLLIVLLLFCEILSVYITFVFVLQENISKLEISDTQRIRWRTWKFNNTFSVLESAYEDEEQFARGGTTPGEGIVDEKDGSPGGEDGTNSFSLGMAADAARGRLIAAAGGFLRGAGQHVNLDPEAPPLPQQQQTINLLERPEIDKKVKVWNTYVPNSRVLPRRRWQYAK